MEDQGGTVTDGGKKNRSARPVTQYRDVLVKGGAEIGERILQSGC